MDSLVWLRVRSMPVFWPACVYKSYSTATRHTHDMTSLRANKPVLDKEDTIVYFFGVETGSSNVVDLVPNLKYCIVHKDDFVVMPWMDEGNNVVERFRHVCCLQNIAEGTVFRACQHHIFQRACTEAVQYSEQVLCEADAINLFMTLLTISSSHHKRKATSSTTSNQYLVTAPSPPAKKRMILEDEALDRVVSASIPFDTWTSSCWELMQAHGWTTGSISRETLFYLAPNTPFSKVQPNINMFESRTRACSVFLHEWISKVQDKQVKEDDAVVQLFWKQMTSMENGYSWQIMTMSTGKPLYIQPHTKFEDWKPMINVFDTKAQAVAKYLNNHLLTKLDQEYGMRTPITSSQNSLPADEKLVNELSDGEDEDVAEEETEWTPSTTQDYAMEDESDVIERNNMEFTEAMNDNSIKLQTENAPVKKHRSRKPKPPHQPKVALSKVSRASRKSATRLSKFTFSFGKLEKALTERGWYYKQGPLHFHYFKPECREKNGRDLIPNQDYFVGSHELELYMKKGDGLKLYREIEAELKYGRDEVLTIDDEVLHEQERGIRAVKKKTDDKPNAQLDIYEISESDSESISHSTKKANKRKKTITKPSTASTLSWTGAERRRAVNLAKATSTIGFGDVWTVLESEGWFYRNSLTGYEYCMPHCKGRPSQETTLDIDYFIEREGTIEALMRLGIWKRVEKQLSEQETLPQPKLTTDTKSQKKSTQIKSRTSVESPREVEIRPHRRVINLVDYDEVEEDGENSGMVGTDVFQTPLGKSRGHVLPMTQELNDKHTSTISPENENNKAQCSTSTEPSTSDNPVVSLSRNLTASFSPPATEKKPVSSDLDSFTLSEYARRAITRLSQSYTPPTLQFRDMERQAIVNFYKKCFSIGSGGSLYLSGAPGCGKSALMRSLEASLKTLHQNTIANQRPIVWEYINAMALTDNNDVLTYIAEVVCSKKFSNREDAVKELEDMTHVAKKRSKTIALVLDEIDILGEKKSMENDLYDLFTLAHRPEHSFILVGIANQVDFTEHHLIRVRQQNPMVEPQVVVFAPYGYETIGHILTERLGGPAIAGSLINAIALQLMARKVASVSGDVRCALEICRRTLLQQLVNDSFGPEYTKSMQLTEVLKLCKVILEGKAKGAAASLPRNLQLILFASTRMVTSTPAFTGLYKVDELYECYCHVSEVAGVFKKLTRAEFRNGLETLSAEGLIGTADLKKQLVRMLTTSSEILQTLKGNPYFDRLM